MTDPFLPGIDIYHFRYIIPEYLLNLRAPELPGTGFIMWWGVCFKK